MRSRISEHPAVYLPLANRKYRGASPRVIDDTTEMVIDGYTRSASTFAVYALQLPQARPVRLAHHLHAPAQLIAGVRAGLPTLLVLREPRGAILSQLIREPGVAMRDALVAYCRFHECLRPYADGMVVAEFANVTHDFGSVVRRLNAKFGMSLNEFVHTPDAMRECLAMIEQRGTMAPHLLGFESGLVSLELARKSATEAAESSAAGVLRDAWVPSGARQRDKDRLLPEWESAGLRRLRQRAGRVYREFARLDPAWVAGRSAALSAGSEAR
jgi:hypothetical protein